MATDGRDWYDSLVQLPRCYGALVDDESRELFRARLELAMERHGAPLILTALSYGDDWVLRGLPEALRCMQATELAMYGCGRDGVVTKRTLEVCGFSVDLCCDSDPKLVGGEFEGVPVISREELAASHPRALIVVATRRYAAEVVDWLRAQGVEEERIFVPQCGLLFAERPNQYFDYFTPAKDEVFVDAGAYDGITLSQFGKWTGGAYRKVYAMEPAQSQLESLKAVAASMHDVEVWPFAAWSHATRLSFSGDDTGGNAKVGPQGEDLVDAIDIDTMVGDERVTFIKMDIEGSEMEALRGAARTIVRDKPRLAISIYHKPWDFLDLTSYILDLVPEYRLKIRHYNSNEWETVLYAFL